MAFETHGSAGLITGENRELDGNPAGSVYLCGIKRDEVSNAGWRHS